MAQKPIITSRQVRVWNRIRRALLESVRELKREPELEPMATRITRAIDLNDSDIARADIANQ